MRETKLVFIIELRKRGLCERPRALCDKPRLAQFRFNVAERAIPQFHLPEYLIDRARCFGFHEREVYTVE